jgi:hypothetical protein
MYEKYSDYHDVHIQYRLNTRCTHRKCNPSVISSNNNTKDTKYIAKHRETQGQAAVNTHTHSQLTRDMSPPSKDEGNQWEWERKPSNVTTSTDEGPARHVGEFQLWTMVRGFSYPAAADMTQCSTATRCDDDDEFTHKQTLTSANNQTTDDDDKKSASIDI